MSSGPIQRLTRVLVVLVTICVLGLVAGIVLVSVENAQTNRRLSALEEYVQGKGEQRDRDNARLREQQRQGVCDLLDQLPAGGLLERPRGKYHCGPGIPLSELTPQERTQLVPQGGPSPAPAAPRTASGAPAPPSPPTTTPNPEPAAPPTAAPPASPPPSGPTGVPDVLCGLLPSLC